MIFPFGTVAALSTTCPHFCPRGLQVPLIAVPLNPPGADGWKILSLRGLESQPPAGLLFDTFDNFAETLYPPCALLMPSGVKAPVRMSCVVPLRDQKEKSISESTPVTLGVSQRSGREKPLHFVTCQNTFVVNNSPLLFCDTVKMKRALSVFAKLPMFYSSNSNCWPVC